MASEAAHHPGRAGRRPPGRPLPRAGGGEAPRPDRALRPHVGATAPLLLLLVLLAAPATGLLPAWGLLPQAPHDVLGLLAGLVAAWLVLVVPWLGAGGGSDPLRPFLVAVAAAPFLVLGGAAAAPGTPVAGPVLLVVAALALALCLGALPPRAGRALAVAVLLLLGGDRVLAAADRGLLPAALNPLRAGAGEPDRREAGGPGSTEVVGLRAGAPTPPAGTPALATGPGPWLVPATVGRLAGEGPLVLLLDGGPGDGTREEPGVGVLVGREAAPLAEPLALDAFDAAVVLSGAWSQDDVHADRDADALLAFVRRGGLLVGPAPGRSWPPPLGHRLGAAGRGVPDEVRSLGLGRVVRASSSAEARSRVAGARRRPALATRFDGAVPPGRPAGMAGWQDPVAGRRAPGALLGVYALVVGLLVVVLRGRLVRLVGVALPAAAVAVGLLWTVEAAPAVVAEGVVLDLGGSGGRRVEAVRLEAGPAGWTGHVAWRGGGIVWQRGGGRDEAGRVVLAPGEAAWAVRDRLGLGLRGAGEKAPAAAWVRGLLRGTPAPARLRHGRLPDLPVAIEGVDRVPAAVLVWR